MDLASNVYQTTYKKDDSQGIIYIAVASLLALVILFGAVYFMFFNTGEQQAKELSNMSDKQSNSAQLNESMKQAITTTPTITPTATPTSTPQTEQEDKKEESENHQEEQEDTATYDVAYVYGRFQQTPYAISEDKTKILEASNVIYSAPSGYTITSFYIKGNAIFIVLKTPEAYTYEFRKVYKGTSNLGGLFYKYYSAFDMTSFVVDPVNYKSKSTYIIFTSRIKKQFLILKIENFKEVGKKVVNAPNFDTFASAYKMANQDAVLVKYKTTGRELQEVLVNFGQD